MYIVVIVVMILLGTLIYVLVTRRDDKHEAILNKQIENPYMGLRKQVLSLKPQDLNLNIGSDKETAFCVVAELGTDDGTATITSLLTGDASLYTSSGGGIIGGASHENVSKAAVAFVTSAQNYFTKMGAENMALPKPKHIKFHILTNKGQYSFDGLESEITDTNSEWADLFNKANDVITQLRLSSN